MFLEKLEELSSFGGCRLPRSGSAFYSERGSRTKEGSREAPHPAAEIDLAIAFLLKRH